MAAQERIARDLDNAQARLRLNAHELAALAGSPLFRGVTRERLLALLKPQGEVSLRPGAVLLELGQRNACIYLLISGRLAILRSSRIDWRPL